MSIEGLLNSLAGVLTALGGLLLVYNKLKRQIIENRVPSKEYFHFAFQLGDEARKFEEKTMHELVKHQMEYVESK